MADTCDHECGCGDRGEHWHDEEFHITDPVSEPNKPDIRQFETGATRDTDEGKPDYEGFLSPLVIEAFGRYMHKNRVQSDGSLRASDNWQKGMPYDAYIKSGFRHFMDWWMIHRDIPPESGADAEEALCALLFNVQGYLHELLKETE